MCPFVGPCQKFPFLAGFHSARNNGLLLGVAQIPRRVILARDNANRLAVADGAGFEALSLPRNFPFLGIRPMK